MILSSLILLILSNAATLRRDKSVLFSRVTQIILVFASFITINSLYLSYLDRGIGLYGGLFNVTSITHIFHIFIFIITALILTLTGYFPRKVWVKDYSSFSKLFFHTFIYNKIKIINNKAEQYKIIEYPLIILFIVSGSLFLVSTSDMVSIFLAIELQSYGLYLLCAIYRNSELATSGSLTYFLLGGLSSCFILLGLSLLYANSGTTNLENLYVIASISELTYHDDLLSLAYWYKPYYIHFSLLIMSVGFLFKIAAAPFHNWSPDVYDAVPTIVTTFIAIIPKISIFMFFLELVYFTSKSLIAFNFTWTYTLLVSSLFSLLIGSIVGLTQSRIKRLFAYSTISHVGFILMGLSINSIESIQAFIFYVMQYSISNLNAFIIIISIGYTYYVYLKKEESENLQDKNNSPIQLISQLKGYFYLKPILALSLAITLFSFAGIPPLVGFFAKQMILTAAIDNGYIFLSLVAILTSVISAVYYLAIIRQIFFDKSDYKLNPELNLTSNSTSNTSMLGVVYDNSFTKKEKVTFNVNNIVLSSSLSTIISFLTLFILLFILTPSESLSIANILALIIFNP